MGQFSDDPHKDREILELLERIVPKERRGRPKGSKNKPKKRKHVLKTLARMNELAELGDKKKFKVEQTTEIAPDVEKVETKLISPKITRSHNRKGLTYFTEEVRLRCLDLAREGVSNGKIAQALGVSLSAIESWKRKSKNFSIQVEAAQSLATEMVESRLFRRAVGYDAPKEVVQFTKEGETLRAPTFQHVPPDVEAAKFWLKNRKPTQWRDHIDTDVTLIPRLVVQTHLGDEVLHDAKTIEENTPRLLNSPQEPQTEEVEGADHPVNPPPSQTE